MTTEAMPQPGQRLGQYTITEFRAQGGMGIVYRAHDNRLQRDVALKVLFPHLTADAGFAARFQREAISMAQMQHPNIVQVFDADVVDGVHYLAMEYVPGDNLHAYMQKVRATGRPFPERTALIITRQMASALDYAHRKGLVHRDVKPSNIMCVSEDRWVLADFGIVLDTSGPRLTRVMSSIGTPEYMSPEQGMAQSMDGRSDQYSLGIVLFEMLAGKTPFKSDSELGTIYMHVHEPLPDLTAIRKDLNKAIVRVVQRSTAKLPDQRFPTAADMVRALDGALGNAPDGAAVRSAGGPGTPPGGVAVRGKSPQPANRPAVAAPQSARGAARATPPAGNSALGKLVGVIAMVTLLLVGVLAAGLLGVFGGSGGQVAVPTPDAAAVAANAVATPGVQQAAALATTTAVARSNTASTATAVAAATKQANASAQRLAADATATLAVAQCPQATPELFSVEPVKSPTNLLDQTVNVTLGNSDRVTIETESGVFVSDTPGPVKIILAPGVDNHLRVVGHVREMPGAGGCNYGGYQLTTERDRNGGPLTIVQSSAAAVGAVQPPTDTPAAANPPTKVPPTKPAPTCQTGKAEITSPREGDVIRGIVTVSGTAICDSFAYYKFEFVDTRCAGGLCFAAGKFTKTVENGVLMRWDTSKTWDGNNLPNGVWRLRMTLVGADRPPGVPYVFPRFADVTVTIQN